MKLKPINHAWFGWNPDRLDPRDHVLTLKKRRMPSVVDLSIYGPPIWDQGPYGSCTSQAILRHDMTQYRIEMGKFPPMLSRMQHYYNERALEGTTRQDAGAYIRDGIKVLDKMGVADESLWSYTKVHLFQRPPNKVQKAGLPREIDEYARVPQTGGAMMACLAANRTFVLGFAVTERAAAVMSVAGSGIIPLFDPGQDTIVGGHAVCPVGFGQHKGYIKAANSWGADCGDEGYIYLPIADLENPAFADDFWNILNAE